LIHYAKADRPRILRLEAPEPPFSAATAVLPYSYPRSAPLALDYVRLTATAVENADVIVSNDSQVEIERGPVLIDATEAAELVYRRGEKIHRVIAAAGLPLIHLISTAGVVPRVTPTAKQVMVLCAWPLLFEDLDRLARQLAEAGWRWGLAIPVLFPATTDFETIGRLADLASLHSAEFLMGVRLDVDPNARRALAAMFPTDDETYSTLFDEGVEHIVTATERHIAAVAVDRAMGDLLMPPDSEVSNWAAAALTGTAGYRLIHMEEDLETGWELVRAAHQIAELSKPLRRIAETASLTIVQGLPGQLTPALEQWLNTGRADLFDQIAARWRLRRDYVPTE
jgi:hypothetical protein